MIVGSELPEGREDELIADVVASRRREKEMHRAARRLTGEAVRRALEGGVSRRKLAAALHVSVARVYQLRDRS
ncbi:hypothetical protein SEA_CEPENS_42 [Mycobacterium phage Cepens]|nr:hypothetical protein SEA_ARGIE_43 [Mycobacterium phage Argie]QBP32706.1 hypothetical protein SEA_CEPENS_42 [Mycobacterium phage Cepens]